MAKLKVGDRVKVVACTASICKRGNGCIGSVGTITNAYRDEEFIVDIFSPHEDHWSLDELRLISKAIESMDKKYIIIDDDGEAFSTVYDTLAEAQEAFEEKVDNQNIDDAEDARIYEVTKAYRGKRVGMKFVETDL